MSRDYYTLQPDKIYRVGKHYTPGRAGQKIQFITRHHLMYIGEGEAVVDGIWNHRPASAHHVIGPTGRWVQTVYDRDTAWANASQWANQRTIAIEHSNNTGRAHGSDFHPDSWNISEETIISGARVAAAYCLYFNLGRPVYGKNIRDHFEFTATGCPVHLSGPRTGNGFGGRAGKYHQQWMDEAQRFYDELKAGKTVPAKPVKKESKGATMKAVDQVNAHTRAFITGYLSPQIDALQDVWTQLRGPKGKGWEQLGINDKGQNLTLVDAVAAIRQQLTQIQADVNELKRRKK
ncbi:N-acetylmuramoyl-L-alanine amidase [Corynebacterium sp. MSK004]|uniref:peptidoglycan recognition protein family protein n=1 Tax=Corynebacterium sp. MSK004 TaxID=3050186 RepID=UPI00254EF3C4|nr:N-acetylmuramoyl-L-alanine amidase [Corynebacterium sp. MSK004]MDK8898107.1 N-acetylmuramoyl-L-alanine amidase [Corynebacterium sp. MSK004]